MASTYGGPVNISTNAGVSWGTFAPALPYIDGIVSTNWHGVACSADGKTMVAADDLNGPLFISTDAGVTWATTNIMDVFQGAACSADGKTIVVVASHEDFPPFSYSYSGVYFSNDQGNTWTKANAPSQFWLSAACSGDGTVIIAGGPTPYISTNSGATWNPTPLQLGDCWVACSADGAKIIAGTSGYQSTHPIIQTGAVYTSSDTGRTWRTAMVCTNFGVAGVASSADGTALVVAGYGAPIYRSTDSGITWNAMDAPVTNWYSLASSADGNTVIAASSNVNGDSQGLVYLWQATPAPRLNLAPNGGSVALSWALPSRQFVLQQTDDLSTLGWVDVTNAPVLNFKTLQNEVALPPTSGHGFYRLISRNP